MADFDAYSPCTLCPRECGADRLHGDCGFCGVEATHCRVATMLAHHGEEPPIAGVHGSGTIFFSGCSCGCFFCQNHQISQEGLGTDLTPEELYQRAAALLDSGVHNLNFVTPEHYWPHIRQLCVKLRENGYYQPFVWNSSGYFKLDYLKEQSDIVDIFLPDFKYSSPELAEECMGDSRYPEIAMKGIRYLVEKLGNLRPFDRSGEMTASRGVMIRHLVLPGEIDNSLNALERIAREIGTDVPLAVMSQFMPVPACAAHHRFTRKVTSEEYQRVCDKIEELGFERVFIQEDNGDDGFLPDFTQEKPFGLRNA